MNKKGFSFIEIIIVISILGILITIAVPKFLDIREEAKEAKEAAVIAAVKEGLNIFNASQLI